ncbi:MAG: MBL fold metallo-hydrolase [Vulcanimicrobiaceae bacterium]
MTDHALKYINAYLIEGDDGYTLVDCGWGLPEVLQTLEDALGELGKRIDQIKWVIATHYHTDHYGLAGTIANLGGAKLMMHPADWAILNTRFRHLEAEMRERDRWFASNGFSSDGHPSDEVSRVFARRFTLKEPDRDLADGDELRIGSHRFRVVWTPGHTPGHICLYDDERKVLLSGDHVLPRITPHIGYWNSDAGDPLGTFLESLRKVGSLGAKTALPAHREPIEDLPGRIEELLEHHVKREAQVRDALNGAMTGTEVASRLTWRRNLSRFDDLPTRERSYALVETLAHLEHLRANGVVEKYQQAGVYRYRHT